MSPGVPVDWLPHSNYHRLLKKKKGGKKLSECPQVCPGPQPQVDGGPAALAQAGDVGSATRGRHDALGGAARNVVIDLSTWRGDSRRVTNRYGSSCSPGKQHGSEAKAHSLSSPNLPERLNYNLGKESQPV